MRKSCSPVLFLGLVASLATQTTHAATLGISPDDPSFHSFQFSYNDIVGFVR